MSSETKARKGVRGQNNALHKPFRLSGGGLYPLYMRRILGPDTSKNIGRAPPSKKYKTN